MTDEQIVDVVLAHMQGKKIQYGYSDSWADCQDNHPNWDFSRFNYRVAPEPRKPKEWILIEHGSLLRAIPIEVGKDFMSSKPSVRVREVIE